MFKILCAGFLILIGTTVFASAQSDRVGPAQVQAVPDLSKVLPEKCYDENDPNFSRYGWCHDEMHRLGWIQDLIKQTASSCCDSGNGGECRLTVVDRVEKWAYLEKQRVPYQQQYFPRYGIIDGLKPGYAIVCGHGTGVYCIATSSGL